MLVASRRIEGLLLIGVLCGLALNLFALHTYSSLGGDFEQDYQAGLNLRVGNSVYSSWNDHPPTNAFFFLPFTFLSDVTAWTVFGLVSLAALLVTVILVSKEAGLEHVGKLVLALATLFSSTTYSGTALGATSAIVSFCIIAGWVLLRRARPEIAGILFTFAGSLKLYPGIVALYLLAKREWRALFSIVVSASILLLLTVDLLGVQDFLQYVFGVMPTNAKRYADFPSNVSVTGVATRLFGVDLVWTQSVYPSVTLSVWLPVVVCCVLCVATYLRLLRTPLRNDPFGFSLLLVTMLLVSPISWGHYFHVLLLPIAALLREYRDARTTSVGLLLIALLILFNPPQSWLVGASGGMGTMQSVWVRELLNGFQTIGLGLLWFACYRRVGRKA